jgi:hypothetical protein
MSPLFVAVYTFIARNLAGLPRTELYLDIYQFDLAQRYRKKAWAASPRCTRTSGPAGPRRTPNYFTGR